MSVNTVFCPRCGLPIVVGVTAAARVTCPRCLGEVENPAALPGDRVIRRAIPLDRQARADRIGTTLLLILMLPLIIAGVGFTLWKGGLTEDAGPLILTSIIAALASYVLIEILLNWRSGAARRNGTVERQGFSEGRAGLQYFAGLLVGLAISVGAWLVGWPSLTGSSLLWAVIAVPLAKLVLSVILLYVRNWRAFGIGLLTSVPIGVLIFGFSLVRDILTAPCWGHGW